jgi:hypothetical protein
MGREREAKGCKGMVVASAEEGKMLVEGNKRECKLGLF